MARLAPGLPYHVTQRGNRRQPTFFEDDDFELYRDLLAGAARRSGTRVWTYCLNYGGITVTVYWNYGDSLLNSLGITVTVY